VRRNVMADGLQLFFAALGGKLGAPMMVTGYLVVAVFLLAYVSAQVHTNSLMEDVAAQKRREVVAREKIGVLTARYATMTSKSRVSRQCEEGLGLVESTTSDVVRVVLDGATFPETTASGPLPIERVFGRDIGNLARVMRQ
jgi:hypothetical protein